MMNFADALRRLEPTAEITALGTVRGLDTTLIPTRGYPLGRQVCHMGQLHRQTGGRISGKSSCRYEGFVCSPGKSARNSRIPWLWLGSLGWLSPSTRRRLLPALVKTA